MAEPMLERGVKLVQDFFTVFFDMIYWLWRTLWSLNRGVIRTLLPGQRKTVQTIVTYLVVMLEIVGLWVVAVGWAAQH